MTSASEWLAVLLSYLLGAVPFGLIFARWFAGIDLRQFGSGNIGATNATRALGRPLGFTVFALDCLKGWLPVILISPALSADPDTLRLLQVLCGAAAVLGHCYPIYLGFVGGKGVATGCGALVGLDPAIFLIGAAVWLLVLFTSRYVALASIAMGAAFPIAAWFRRPTGSHEVFLGATLLFVLILIRHRSNLRRILAGTEPKSGAERAHVHE
jgi:glycerol-3-phosphate acyltransferase PlsY